MRLAFNVVIKDYEVRHDGQLHWIGCALFDNVAGNGHNVRNNAVDLFAFVLEAREVGVEVMDAHFDCE